MKAQPLSEAPDCGATPTVPPESRATAVTAHGPSKTTTPPRPPSRRAFLFHQRLANTEIRLRFRMRTFLFAMTAAALATGLLSAQARRMETLVAQIEGRGGVVIYDTARANPNNLFNAWRMLASGGNEAWAARPLAVVFPSRMQVTDEDLRLVSRMGSIEVIHLDGYFREADPGSGTRTWRMVTDRGLAYLERLPRLRQLTLIGAAVTPTAVAKFRVRRPDCFVVDDPAQRLAFLKL